MGIKGDKKTIDGAQMAQLIIEKLNSLPELSQKNMFGGVGIFSAGKMFGIIDSKGQAFLKVDDSNRERFESHGATQHSRMPYYSIPKDVINDVDELISWATSSIEIKK